MPDPSVDVHNDLRARTLTQAGRYMTTVNIGGPFVENAPDHVNEHNKLCIALIHLMNVGNDHGAEPYIAISLPDEAHVGDTGHVSDHALIETALQVIEAAVLPWETP